MAGEIIGARRVIGQGRLAGYLRFLSAYLDEVCNERRWAAKRLMPAAASKLMAGIRGARIRMSLQ